MQYTLKIPRKETVLWVLLIISIFILNAMPRMILLNGLINDQSKMWMINLLFLISSTLLLIYYIKKRKINFKVIYIILIIMGLMFVNALFRNITVNTFIVFITTYIISLMLISIKLDNVNKISRIFLKIYNVVIILLTIYGIIDYLTNGSLQLFIADNLAYGEFQLLIYGEHGLIYRMYSFFGHPLDNAQLYLIFFTVNKLYNRYYEKFYNDYILLIITSIGLILSGSKTALCLACFLFIFCSGIKKRKWLYYIFLIISLTILFNTSMFQNNLLQRFQYGIEYNDMSSGRDDVLKEVIRLGIKPNWIISEGIGSSREITTNAMAGAENFEYPPIMLAYDYGIIETSLIYILIFIHPLMIFIKNRHYYILFNYLVVFLYANSNNGLDNLGTESMAMLCFVIMLFMNISRNNKTTVEVVKHSLS